MHVQKMTIEELSYRLIVETGEMTVELEKGLTNEK